MGRVGKKNKNFGRGIVGIWQRELGDLRPRSFANRAGASEDLVLRLGIHRKLNQHNGCVNTVSFNADGDILVSGSDDRMIILWDWDIGKVKLSFHSCHSNNVFQARFMPFTNDRTIITCAADGEVRYAQIQEGGQVVTQMLAKHEGRAHKLAIEPGSSHVFYSCGEDGLVQHFDLRTKSATWSFICRSFQAKSAYRKIVRLNAITIDPRNANLFAVAGSDEYARLYDIRKNKFDSSSNFGQPTEYFCPPHLIGTPLDGITGLAFSDQSELLASYADEAIFLFSKNQGFMPSTVSQTLGSSKDVNTSDTSSSDSGSLFFVCEAIDSEPVSEAIDYESLPQVYTGHQNSDTVKEVSFFGPNCEYVVSGSDCGRIFIWRKKDGELLRVMEGDKDVVNCIEPHPYATTIASSGFENDIKMWTPNAMERVLPVNLDELSKERNNRAHHACAQQLLARIWAQQRRQFSVRRFMEESSNLGTNYSDGDGSFEDNGSAEYGSENHPEQCVVS